MSKPVKLILLIVILLAAISTATFVYWKHGDNYYSYSKPPHPDPLPPVETTLFFAGDVMLSREVGNKITGAKDPTLPFHDVVDQIRNADISFANLESPFYDQGPRVTQPQSLVFKAEPEFVEGLKYAGFDILSTANNHAYDQGRKGIDFTLNHLRSSGIVSVGTGSNCHDGVVLNKNGIRFGFLSYSYSAFNDGGNVPDAQVCDWNDINQIEEDITKIKTKSDFVIVSGHYGIEYERQPQSKDVKTAYAIVDAGADLVIGHHPHWFQTIEQYKGKWIFYSLGNFVFDQMWSTETREGLGLNITFLDKALSDIEVLPAIIENFCCPRWATPVESQKILRKINPDATGNFIMKNGIINADWTKHVTTPNLTSDSLLEQN